LFTTTSIIRYNKYFIENSGKQIAMISKFRLMCFL
jgi:hypothetical protein